MTSFNLHRQLYAEKLLDIAYCSLNTEGLKLLEVHKLKLIRYLWIFEWLQPHPKEHRNRIDRVAYCVNGMTDVQINYIIQERNRQLKVDPSFWLSPLRLGS